MAVKDVLPYALAAMSQRPGQNVQVVDAVRQILRDKEERQRDMAFGQELFSSGQMPTEEQIVKAAAKYQIPPDRATNIIGKFVSFRAAQNRQGGQQFRPDLFQGPSGQYEYISPGQSVPQGYRPAARPGGSALRPDLFKTPSGKYQYVQPGTEVPEGYTPASRTGSSGLSGMKTDAWSAYMSGNATPAQMKLIGVDKDPYLSAATQLVKSAIDPMEARFMKPEDRQKKIAEYMTMVKDTAAKLRQVDSGTDMEWDPKIPGLKPSGKDTSGKADAEAMTDYDRNVLEQIRKALGGNEVQ